MTQPESILQILAFNEYTLSRHLEGITAEDALPQLPFRGNCLNWVMGHLANSSFGWPGTKPITSAKPKSSANYPTKPTTPLNQNFV